MSKTKDRSNASRASKLDWLAIKMAFVNGKMSPAEHAVTYGVGHDAMRARVSRGKWNAEREAMSHAVAAVSQAARIKTRVQELAEFDEADARMSKALRSVAASMLVAASKPDAKKLTATEARTIASLAESAQKIGRIALGATTENVGLSGVAGLPPVAMGRAPSAAVAKAMNDYLHDF